MVITLLTEPGSKLAVTATSLPVLAARPASGSRSMLASVRISPVSGSLTMATPPFEPGPGDVPGEDVAPSRTACARSMREHRGRRRARPGRRAGARRGSCCRRGRPRGSARRARPRAPARSAARGPTGRSPSTPTVPSSEVGHVAPRVVALGLLDERDARRCPGRRPARPPRRRPGGPGRRTRRARAAWPAAPASSRCSTRASRRAAITGRAIRWGSAKTDLVGIEIASSLPFAVEERAAAGRQRDRLDALVLAVADVAARPHHLHVAQPHDHHQEQQAEDAEQGDGPAPGRHPAAAGPAVRRPAATGGPCSAPEARRRSSPGAACRP